MSCSAKPASAKTRAAQWNYVDVQVLDGERVLHPTHISFNHLNFTEPPNLSAEFIQIILTNNGQSHASQARVLPHDRASARIPIQLIDEQNASTKLTA
jgi:hypothetical protein